jgi:hypothetical protein
MDDIRRELLRNTLNEYGEIYPACGKRSLEECFTVEDSKILFWFNDSTGNTHVRITDLEQVRG